MKTIICFVGIVIMGASLMVATHPWSTTNEKRGAWVVMAFSAAFLFGLYL